MKKTAKSDVTYCVATNCDKKRKCMRHHSHYDFRSDRQYSYFVGNKEDKSECTEFTREEL